MATCLEIWLLLGCRYGCYLVVVMWWLLGCSDVVTIPGWRRGGYLVRDEREWKREGESGSKEKERAIESVCCCQGQMDLMICVLASFQ